MMHVTADITIKFIDLTLA